MTAAHVMFSCRISAPPGRLSTTICRVSACASSTAPMRATLSDALPGACGTIKRMARLGYGALL